jgi:hypothetical protein
MDSVDDFFEPEEVSPTKQRQSSAIIASTPSGRYYFRTPIEASQRLNIKIADVYKEMKSGRNVNGHYIKQWHIPKFNEKRWLSYEPKTMEEIEEALKPCKASR